MPRQRIRMGKRFSFVQIYRPAKETTTVRFNVPIATHVHMPWNSKYEVKLIFCWTKASIMYRFFGWSISSIESRCWHNSNSEQMKGIITFLCGFLIGWSPNSYLVSDVWNKKENVYRSFEQLGDSLDLWQCGNESILEERKKKLYSLEP